MTGADALVDELTRHGVEVVFGLVGSQTLPILDALYRTGSIRYVAARYEQAAAFMAYGYSRARQRPGVCLATAGPAATNLLSGVAAAQKTRVPLVALVGKQERYYFGTDVFGELDHVALFTPVTKWSQLVPEVGRIRPMVQKAFRTALQPPLGAVHLDLPRDVQVESLERDATPPPSPVSESQVVPAPDLIDRLLDRIGTARRPAILVGRDVLWARATDQLVQLAERWQAPVCTIDSFVDAFPDTHPLGMGPIGREGWSAANEVLRQADLLLALGAELPFLTTRFDWSVIPQHLPIVQVCLPGTSVADVYPVELAAFGDVGPLLGILLERGAEYRARWDVDALAELKATWKRQQDELAALGPAAISTDAVAATLRRLMEPNAIMVSDSGAHTFRVHRQFDTYQPGTFYDTENIGTVGCGLPIALGVKLAEPARRVVAVCGDGGFAMTVAELETAVRERLDVTAVVINDFGFGIDRRFQRAQFGDRAIGVDHGNPDFARLAESFGIRGVRITRPDELEPGLRAALAHAGPCVVDVHATSD